MPGSATFALCAGVAILAGCGARTPLLLAEVTSDASAPPDAGPSPDASHGQDAQPPPPPPPPPPPAGPRIGIFGLSGSPAYDSSALVSFLQAYPASVTRTQTDTSTPVTPDNLSSFDVIILDRLQRTYTAEEAGALEAWVSAGGGVLSLTGFANSPDPDVTRPNSLLAPLGGQYLPPLLEPPPSIVTISQFASSPVTTGIGGLPFAGGYGVQVQPGWTPVAFDSGTPIAMIGEQGSGRIYMWGDEWVEYSMEWGNDLQAFWQDGIDWLLHRR